MLLMLLTLLMLLMLSLPITTSFPEQQISVFRQVQAGRVGGEAPTNYLEYNDAAY